MAILFFTGYAARAVLLERSSADEILTIKIQAEEMSSSSSLLSDALANAELPQNISLRIQESATADSAFIKAVFGILQSDRYLWMLVDKEHPLPENYKPDDLVKLTKSSYWVNKEGLLLRSAAAASLKEMATAARSEKLRLTVSSAHRPYNYQSKLYKRNVKALGQHKADMGTARPGYSQHHLGLTVDFGSVTNAFAKTAESRWLAANASRFGWSLSYPEGCEEITGYRWESWHYRYIGKELAEFIDTYFDGIQQYALRFLHEFSNLSSHAEI